MTAPIIALAVLCLFESARSQAAGIAYWDVPRRGANYDTLANQDENLAAAQKAGIEFLRLFPNKWPSRQRDFLLGNADQFEKIYPEDFRRLKETLDVIAKRGLKAVLTTSSLPGARWRQQNGGKDDAQLWRDEKFHAQAASFWKELAARLKGHPAIAAYNILNEPHPERSSGFTDFKGEHARRWAQKVAGTAADLNRFNREVVAAIREVDGETPILLDSGFYAAPWAFDSLQPVSDDKVLYSFHMYEPFRLTNERENKRRYSYPGPVPLDEEFGEDGPPRRWNAQALEKFLDPVMRWQERNHIAANRILVGEFGCNRTVKGAAEYLGDLMAIFNRHGWHWAFYAYREKTWPGMDYELGTRRLNAEQWAAIDRGEPLDLPRRNNPIFNAIRKGLSR